MPPSAHTHMCDPGALNEHSSELDSDHGSEILYVDAVGKGIDTSTAAVLRKSEVAAPSPPMLLRVPAALSEHSSDLDGFRSLSLTWYLPYLRVTRSGTYTVTSTRYTVHNMCGGAFPPPLPHPSYSNRHDVQNSEQCT